jgi:hypothetical protein
MEIKTEESFHPGMSVPVIPAFSRGQDIVLLKDYKYK